MIFNAINVHSTHKSVTPPVFNLQHVNIAKSVYCCKWDNRWKGVAIRETDFIMGWFCRPFLSSLPFWQQDHYLFFCAWRTGGVLPAHPEWPPACQPCACFCLWWRQMPRGGREGVMPVLAKLCSLVGLCQRAPGIGVQVREGSCWAHVTDMRESGDPCSAVCTILQ